jgi:hypothetical protein
MMKAAGRYLFAFALMLAAFFFAAIASRYLAALPGLPSDSRAAIRALVSLPPYPLHVLCAFITAVAAAREFRQREGMWIFVLPALWFSIGISLLTTSNHSVLAPETTSRWELLFSRDLATMDPWNVRGIDWRKASYPMLFTLPFLVSIAYSLGTIVGLKYPAKIAGKSPDATAGEQLEL